ncbi:MAG: C40 family peptidase [Burkholderiaceae bacterium]
MLREAGARSVHRSNERPNARTGSRPSASGHNGIALHLLLSLLMGLCLLAPGTARAGSDAESRTRHEVLLRSLMLLGVDYRFGGSSPSSGVDCSALVKLVMATGAGIDVPRRAADQARVGRRIRARDLRAGDLVFFNTRGRRNSHVGVYLGETALSSRHHPPATPCGSTRCTSATGAGDSPRPRA